MTICFQDKVGIKGDQIAYFMRNYKNCGIEQVECNFEDQVSLHDSQINAKSAIYIYIYNRNIVVWGFMKFTILSILSKNVSIEAIL